MGLAYSVGSILPYKMGKSLAAWLARWLAQRKDLPMVQAVRANQWVVSGCQLTREELDKAVFETFRNTAMSLYAFYRYFRKAEKVEKLAPIPEKLLAILKESKRKSQALIVVGIHLSNFDLALLSVTRQALAIDGVRGIVISFPNPGKGYRWQNEIREQVGFPIIPGSLDAAKEASKVLSEGGIVVTGIDRPLPGTVKYHPIFFGHPAELPSLHITLALRHSVPIVVTGMLQKPDGEYQLLASDPIHMDRYSNRKLDIIDNASKILRQAENFILTSPHEWSMYYPVWPDLIPMMP